MSRDMIDALKKKYEAEVEIAKATIQVYLDKLMNSLSTLTPVNTDGGKDVGKK
jgi:hypothetical protein